MALLSVASVSAADSNATGNIGEDVLGDDPVDDKSFIDFYVDMKNTQGLNFDLADDYKFDYPIDSDNVGGINITKNKYSINGNNHVIDCNGKARAFTVTGKNVKISNLIIKNGAHGEGSAIYVTGSDLTLNNVTFINCSGGIGESSEGAVSLSGVEATIKNCKFIDNSGQEGASVSAFKSIVTVDKSTFISSSNKIIKGHILLSDSDLTLSNSEFLNTTSKYATALFAEGNCTIKISKSKFKNLFANMTAGAIGVKGVPSLTIRL